VATAGLKKSPREMNFFSVRNENFSARGKNHFARKIFGGGSRPEKDSRGLKGDGGGPEECGGGECGCAKGGAFGILSGDEKKGQPEASVLGRGHRGRGLWRVCRRRLSLVPSKPDPAAGERAPAGNGAHGDGVL
jgi:hypothetical protein